MSDPEELAKFFGPEAHARFTGGHGAPNGGQPDPAVDTTRQPVDLLDPALAKVAEELAIDSGDRSKDTYRIICACVDCGLGLSQTRWVIDSSPVLGGRLSGRHDDDIARSYHKAQNEWQRRQPSVAGGPIPAPPGAPQTVAGASAAPGGGPGRFFGRHGLMALNLAAEVMGRVTCGYGRPDERFYTYDNGVWTPGAEPIEAEVARLLGNRYRSTHAPLVCTIIKYLPDCAHITDAPLADYINCPNGMVRWTDGAILPHDPGYLSTVQLPVEFTPGADCPQFDQFLDEVLPDDLIAPTPDSPYGFIWELIGYTLFSGNPLQVAVLLLGKGRNGKGVLIRVIKTLLGANNYSAVTLHELVENRFRVASLYGKLANLAGDLDSKWLENTALFKKITGHDALQGEYKYGANFNFSPWALPFYSANKAFGSPDSSEGWVARWVVVPFPNSFLGREDRTLDEKLTSELELRGILARGVAALPALMARGRFADIPSLQEAKTAFVMASDAVRSWLDEHCLLEPDAWTPRTDLYKAYRWDTGGDGGAQLGAREFYNRVEQVAGIISTVRNGQRGFKGVQVRVQPVSGISPGQRFWGAKGAL